MSGSDVFNNRVGLVADAKISDAVELIKELRVSLCEGLEKGDEIKLEKQRKKYMANHTDDKESAWLNEVASINKK